MEQRPYTHGGFLRGSAGHHMYLPRHQENQTIPIASKPFVPHRHRSVPSHFAFEVNSICSSKACLLRVFHMACGHLRKAPSRSLCLGEQPCCYCVWLIGATLTIQSIRMMSWPTMNGQGVFVKLPSRIMPKATKSNIDRVGESACDVQNASKTQRCRVNSKNM